MTAINGWPGKPFMPLHPEKDGWHWMKTPDNEVMPFEWRAEGECERGHWPSYWVSQGEDCWTAEECEYIGPVLTPDEATALQKRVAELRQIIRYVAGCEHATASDEDLLEQVAAAICRMNNIDPTGHISIDGGPFDWAWRHYLPQARAALTGGKE